MFVVKVIFKQSTEFIFDLLDHNAPINNLQLLHQHNLVNFQKLPHHEEKMQSMVLQSPFKIKI